MAFYVLGSTADAFLSPALETIATKLSFSENLAGVTLLALGNGAPDIFASLSAAGSDQGGIYFAVGALLGGGLFITGVVSSVVIFSVKEEIEIVGVTFIRDIMFYFAGIGVLIGFVFVGELTYAFSIIYIGIYIVFVITVVIMDYRDR